MTVPSALLSLYSLSNDSCVIQNRSIDSSGKIDNETWTSQTTTTRCRVIKQVNRRRSSPDGSEKVQYGTFVFTNIVLPVATNVLIHDRIVHRGRVYDVLEVIETRDAKGPHHLVALCDVRA